MVLARERKLSTEAALRRCDQARREAMINADTNALEQLLADELCWTHSSGTTEGKRTFLSAIASGAVRYQALDIEADTVRGTATMLIHEGVLRGSASRDGLEKALNAKFLAVWCGSEDRWQLTAWQSTNWIG